MGRIERNETKHPRVAVFSRDEKQGPSVRSSQQRHTYVFLCSVSPLGEQSNNVYRPKNESDESIRIQF